MRISSSCMGNRESRREAIQELCHGHHFTCVSITHSSMDSEFRTHHCYSIMLLRCGDKAPNKEIQRNLPLR
jgi:hypothetical protein